MCGYRSGVSNLMTVARDLAAGLLDTPQMDRRWAHVQGVGQRAAQLTVTVEPGDRDLLVAAAWLHDIGYAEAASTRRPCTTSTSPLSTRRT